jgi:hypothetical protein
MRVQNSIRSGKWHKGIVHVESKDTVDSMRIFIERFIASHGPYVVLDLHFGDGKDDRVIIDGSIALNAFLMAWRIRGRVSRVR